jgi:hypothetical protein
MAALDTLTPQTNGNKRFQKPWKLRMPWGQTEHSDIEQGQAGQQNGEVSGSSMSSIARALLLSRRRLQLDPDKNLHFLCERSKLIVGITVCFSLL